MQIHTWFFMIFLCFNGINICASQQNRDSWMPKFGCCSRVQSQVVINSHHAPLSLEIPARLDQFHRKTITHAKDSRRLTEERLSPATPTAQTTPITPNYTADPLTLPFSSKLTLKKSSVIPLGTGQLMAQRNQGRIGQIVIYDSLEDIDPYESNIESGYLAQRIYPLKRCYQQDLFR